MTQYFTGLLWDKTKIIVLYFASSLCPSSLSALSQAFVFAPFPFPFLQAKMTKVQDLHSCNDIVHQRNGYFLLSTFPAPRELDLLSQCTHRRVYRAASAFMRICGVSGSHLASEVVFLQT